MKSLKFTKNIEKYNKELLNKNIKYSKFIFHGFPQLHYLETKYLLPYGAEISDIHVEMKNKYIVHNIYIEPGIEDIPLDGSIIMNNKKWEEPGIYKRGEMFPEHDHIIGNTYSACGHTILPIVLFPYRYDHFKQQIVAFKTVEIKIDLKESFGERIKQRSNLVKSKKISGILKNVVENPEEENSYKLEKIVSVKEAKRYDSLVDPNHPHSMIIITSNTAYNSVSDAYGIHDFAAWKTMHGVKTLVVPTSKILSDPFYNHYPEEWENYSQHPSTLYSPVNIDSQMKIRNFLKHAYKTYNLNADIHKTPLEYVFICGSSSWVPWRALLAGDSTSADIYYSCLEEPYDFFCDGHARFGACGIRQHFSLFPTVAIGRIDTISAEVFKRYFAKVKEHYNGEELNNVITLGDTTSGGDHGIHDNIFPFIPEEYNKSFTPVNGSSENSAGLLNIWKLHNSSPALGVFFGHNSTFMNTNIGIADLENMKKKAGFLYTITCAIWSTMNAIACHSKSYVGTSGATVTQYASAFTNVGSHLPANAFNAENISFALACGLAKFGVTIPAFAYHNTRRAIWGLNYAGDPSLLMRGDYFSDKKYRYEFTDKNPVEGINDYKICSIFRHKGKQLNSFSSPKIKLIYPGGDMELLGFNVYRDGIKINEGLLETPHYRDENIETGKKYTYHVTAVYKDHGESNPSNKVDAVAYDLMPPKNLIAESGVKEILLRWEKPEEIPVSAAGYYVYRDGKPLNNIPVEEEEYLDKEINEGKTYIYYVTAIYEEGESVPSNEVEGSLISVNAPQNLKAVPKYGAIELTWDLPEILRHK